MDSGTKQSLFSKGRELFVFCERDIYSNEKCRPGTPPISLIHISRPDSAAYKTTRQAGEDPARSIPILDL